MSLVLIDTSAWIDYLRAGEGPLADILETLLEEDRAALCGVAVTEVRQGLLSHEEEGVLALFETLPYLDSDRADYERAGELLAKLRRQGVTIPAMDGVIAALCQRHRLPLLENDRHFAHIGGLQRIAWREDR